ncbi:Valine--tRNA ligase [Ectocarpus siliculosus]|uniref:valine--tRNA ligase n=1 Tax=Ectocarpus siliculosus TaxID=2880 RepID=D7FV40_ECTSI|nr:Valine--tRNA ligase [Ectocarpus siliculosus]|eukprot:CBJ31846.1 Valine--tRNA ligase [Ectocarpus siliculosus]
MVQRDPGQSATPHVAKAAAATKATLMLLLTRSVAVRSFSTSPASFVPSAAAVRSPLRRLSPWPGLHTLDGGSTGAVATGAGATGHRQPRRWIRASATAAAAEADTAKSGGALRPPSIVDDNGDMATHYDFLSVERSMYAWWEEKGYFKPGGDPKKKSYVVPMPPPNVTGYLHMGHAMGTTLQDILTRYHRMRGEPTLFLPGQDHAGIATQMLVERALAAEGIDRKEIGREAFLKKVWEWKEDKGGYIVRQMRRLGASADWSRERFTLDPEMSAAVTEAFVRLHEKGLVYRGDYMVNWSPSLQTAVSDLEVEYSEEDGKLYYFKYMVAGGKEGEHLSVATTRPETILGDTAVCVHPEDERFKHLVGGKVVVPLSGREIPIIADDYVDMEFGTGALKITPGHDPNDYEIGKRHSLQTINLMEKDGTMAETAGAYAGQDRFDCRNNMWADMEAAGLALKAEPYQQRVPRSQRGGEVIEPLVSSQWFVKTEGMGAKALAAVQEKDIQILPERFNKVWHNWLDGIHDWCVSRQLWWGHQIPVWYASGHDGYFVARSEEDARKQATDAGVPTDVSLDRDPDVLDTWFSSGLWPFASVGWPQEEGNDGGDLSNFYPAACLETGYDIIFFWVARMVMMGIELTGKSPFDTIYLHGLVKDGNGMKMSKTKGNVVDPIDTMDSYGTDALRYTLVTGVTPGQDVPLSMERVQTNMFFANKLWNAGRFLLGNLKGLGEGEREALAVTGPMTAEELETLALPERYIVSKCHRLVEGVTTGLQGYDMGDAGKNIYEFLWDEYADWYIEASKTRIGSFAAGGDGEEGEARARSSRRTLVYVFDTCLRLLHPFMPFITEALWQQLPRTGEALMVAPWPKVDDAPLAVDELAIGRFEAVQSLVRSVRNAKAEYKVEPGKKIPAVVQVSNKALRSDVIKEVAALCLLGRLDPEGLEVQGLDGPPEGQNVHLVVQDGLEVYLPMAGLVDKDKERARLEKQAGKLTKDMEVLEKRLSGSNFVEKAPAKVVEEVRANLQAQKDQLKTVQQAIVDLDL